MMLLLPCRLLLFLSRFLLSVIPRSTTTTATATATTDGVVMNDNAARRLFGPHGQQLRRHNNDRPLLVSHPPPRRRHLQDTSVCLSQIGDDIQGPQDGDLFGFAVSISEHGQIVAVGARNYNGEMTGGNNETGLVQVFQNINNEWTQRGSNIEGQNSDEFLFANALSNSGYILAVGAALGMDNNGVRTGYVRVYQYKFVMGDWQQRGDSLFGSTSGDQFGWSVALSGNGLVLLVGAHSGGGSDRDGVVYVYSWNGSEWVSGPTVDGIRTGDFFGYSISLSKNGNIFAAGAVDSGSVQIFKFASTHWFQIGQVLTGETSDDDFGWSVSLSSDGKVVAIGAPMADPDGIYSRGQVKVFQINESSQKWSQLGSSLNGDSTYYSFGDSVSLSGDASTLAVGARGYSSNLDYKGLLRIFQWNRTDWQQFGDDIVGRNDFDHLGTAVAMSRDGSTVAVGGDALDRTGRPGHAKVFQLDDSCRITDRQVIDNPTEKPSTGTPAVSPLQPPTTAIPSSASKAPMALIIEVPSKEPVPVTDDFFRTEIPTTAPKPAASLANSADDSDALSIGLLVGASVGATAVLIGIGFLMGRTCYYRRNKEQQQTDASNAPAATTQTAAPPHPVPGGGVDPATVVAQLVRVDDVVRQEEQPSHIPLLDQGVARLPSSENAAAGADDTNQDDGPQFKDQVRSVPTRSTQQKKKRRNLPLGCVIPPDPPTGGPQITTKDIADDEEQTPPVAQQVVSGAPSGNTNQQNTSQSLSL